MALQSFAAGVSMSAADISVELGNSITSMLDFQGAAASFSGITDTETTEGFGAAAIEMKEFNACSIPCSRTTRLKLNSFSFLSSLFLVLWSASTKPFFEYRDPSQNTLAVFSKFRQWLL